MRKRWYFLLVLFGFSIPLVMGAFDNTEPADDQPWNTAAGLIRTNNDAIEVELGIGLSMEGSANGWYQSAAPTTKADGSTALGSADEGKFWTDSDDAQLYHWNGSAFVANANGTVTVPRPSALEYAYRFNMSNPSVLQTSDNEWSIDVRTSAAITITRIDITMDADPTTEMDWDLKFADAFIGLANATLIVAMDTTNGAAAITSFTDATVPANKCIYISFGAAPDASATQVQVTVYWDYD